MTPVMIRASMPTSTSSACACSRLRRATRAITQLYDDALAPAGLRTTQFGLLSTLARQQTMTIGSLAAEMLLDRTALSRNLDPLAERGLVEVVPGTDLRTRHVTMTAAGKRALDAAEPLWADAQRDVARRVGKQRLAELYALLDDVERLHPGRPDTKEST
jgi:DNA-binding MarR family transcriptional regulator